ncbi:MAG: hypothetical protein D6688_02855 [Alphaproteobacteria bacterium]|nr:MAG: hypothetical protein D6688_02855 [Alphaproteobacteria bacterium]
MLYNSTKKRYDHMWSVFHHLVDKICGGSANYSAELNEYIEEILTNLADGQTVSRTHTNLSIKPFDPEDFCAGSANANVDKNYVFNQNVATNIWTIVHNLDKYPSVTVTDHSNKVVVPDTIEYLDNNTVRLTFLQPQAGSAILN